MGIALFLTKNCQLYALDENLVPDCKTLKVQGIIWISSYCLIPITSSQYKCSLPFFVYWTL